MGRSIQKAHKARVLYETFDVFDITQRQSNAPFITDMEVAGGV
jgi:hypothetical protein